MDKQTERSNDSMKFIVNKLQNTESKHYDMGRVFEVEDFDRCKNSECNVPLTKREVVENDGHCNACRIMADQDEVTTLKHPDDNARPL